MKKKIFVKVIFAVMGLLIVSLSGSAVRAQQSKARDLYIEKEKNDAKGKPGAKVRILLKRGSEPERYVATNETFYSGDKIKLAFDINFSGYVALLNVGSSGRVTLLYPYVGASSKIEPRVQEQLIPADSRDWIAFNDQPGAEQVTVVFSTNPIQTVEEVVKFSAQNVDSGAAGASASANVTVRAGDGEIDAAASAEAQAKLQALNTSSLEHSRSTLASAPSADATYAVVADPNVIKEPTAFVITLRHENH